MTETNNHIPVDDAVVLYQTEDGHAALEVHLQQETVWLNQTQMVELFQRDQSVVSRHIRNIFKEGELDEITNMQKMHIADSDKPVALALLIAESKPEEKETIVKVIVNLINRNN